jgi:hypothetical protein
MLSSDCRSAYERRLVLLQVAFPAGPTIGGSGFSSSIPHGAQALERATKREARLSRLVVALGGQQNPVAKMPSWSHRAASVSGRPQRWPSACRWSGFVNRPGVGRDLGTR